MLEELASLFGVALVSAFIPVVNIELYAGGLYLLSPTTLWIGAFVAAVGQTLGKVCWYYVGANVTRWQWLARKIDRPAFQERSARLQERLADRQWFTALLMFASALVGLPPLAIMAVVAGHLRMSMPVFVGTVLVGRFLRFAAAMGAGGLIGQLLG